MNETQIWTRKLEDVIQMIRKLNTYKGDSINALWVKSLKSDAKQIIGNLKKLAAKDPAAAQAVKRFSQELRAFDANTIKQKMAYHAREYRRLKALAGL